MKKIKITKIDLSNAKNINDVKKAIKKDLKLGNKFNGSLDGLYKNVEKLKTNIKVDFINPKIYTDELYKYVNVIKSIFYGDNRFNTEKRFYMKDTFKYVFFVFIFYSFIGWLVENFVEIVIKGWTYMPREFLRGPLCPIFGIGAIVLLILLDKYLINDKVSVYMKIPSVFIGSTIITSAIEFMTSYYLEFTTGTWPWKGYANQLFNLGGRIALANSLGFGLISTIGLLFIQPKVEARMREMKYDMIFDVIYYILLILFVLDIIFAMVMPTGVKLDVTRNSWR